MAPNLPEFPVPSADTRFIGNPVDVVVFEGDTQVQNDKGKTGTFHWLAAAPTIKTLIKTLNPPAHL